MWQGVLSTLNKIGPGLGFFNLACSNRYCANRYCSDLGLVGIPFGGRHCRQNTRDYCIGMPIQAQ